MIASDDNGDSDVFDADDDDARVTRDQYTDVDERQ